MNAEAIAALDDPALVVPRVMDVHGTLLRLGFKYWDSSKVTSLNSGSFYRLFVKLFHPVDPPNMQRERRVSHVEFVVSSNDDNDNVVIRVSFGYPERYKKKLKIIERFQKMLSDSIHKQISLRNHDDLLRNLETRLKQLIARLSTMRVDCAFDCDSKGRTRKIIPEHEALWQVVYNAIDCHSPLQLQQDWWREEEEDRPPKKTGVYEPELGRRIYRPSWDRRSGVRRRGVSRGI